MPTYTTTARHALRWLTGSNSVRDIDAGFQALAEDLDAIITSYGQGLIASRPVSTPASPGVSGRIYYATDTGEMFLDTGTGWVPFRLARPEVTSLPAAPYDGQEISYLADPTNGVIWQLKYLADLPAPYRWAFIGGSELYSAVPASESFGSTTYADLATIGPSITVPLAGDYDVLWHAQASTSASALRAKMGIQIGAATVDDSAAVSALAGGGIIESPEGRTQRLTALGAATLLRAKYKINTSGNTGTWSNRVLRARPVRVG